MSTDKGLLELQKVLARAEREGDASAMARGYLVLADELWRVGNRKLGTLFYEKAIECLESIGAPSIRSLP